MCSILAVRAAVTKTSASGLTKLPDSQVTQRQNVNSRNLHFVGDDDAPNLAAHHNRFEVSWVDPRWMEER
jgi:hypothetical protein